MGGGTAGPFVVYRDFIAVINLLARQIGPFKCTYILLKAFDDDMQFKKFDGSGYSWTTDNVRWDIFESRSNEERTGK